MLDTLVLFEEDVFGTFSFLILVSVSSLKQYVFEYENNDYYAVILSDKGDKAYFGIYDKNYNEVSEEEYTSLDNIKEKVINLPGKALVISNIDIDFTYRTTEMKLNLLKLVDYYKDKEDNSFNIKPSYIKKIEVEERL